MRTCLRHFAIGLAMVAGIGAAQAQTVITRDASGDPVVVAPPLVITQPAGTIITRPVETIVTTPSTTVLTQPVGTFVVQPPGTYVTQPATTFVRPAAVVAEPEPVVLQPAPPVVSPAARRAQRTVTPRTVTTTRRTVTARQPAVRSAARRAAPVRTAAVRPPARIPVLAATEPPSLNSRDRGTVYRTIVRETASTPVTGQVLTAPAMRPVVVAPMAAAPIAFPLTLLPPVTTVPVALRVGAILPAGVPLYAIPQALALRIPALRSYSYTHVNDRVLVVDPNTNIVVADITP